jgi:hypothetical protein
MKGSKLKRKKGRLEQIKKGREDENLLCTGEHLIHRRLIT